MCGRFTLRTPSNLLVERFELGVDPRLSPRFNIAPTQTVAAVRRPNIAAKRELALLRWGLIPSWAKDLAVGNRMINARSETIAEKPAFRSAFERRRCLILADGYYEWAKVGGQKQPHYIRMRDEQPFAFAGLWEHWQGVDQPHLPGAVESCTIITTESNDLTIDLHHRMPVILPRQSYEAWLDPELTDRDQLTSLLGKYPSREMCVDPVSTYVNSPKNDDEKCVAIQKTLF
jgi:putative SOS response-associated peptidase YedK